MKIISVIGTTGVGKTTYCEKLIGSYPKDNPPMLVRMGKIFRGIFGEVFFVDQNNPATSEATESLARSLVYYLIQIGLRHDKDMVLDGFPRSLLQLKYLLDTMQIYNVKSLDMRFLYTDEPEQWKRLQNRETINFNSSFYRKKMEVDARQLSELIIEYMRIVKSDSTSQRTFEEIYC